jgi:D-alanine-D-alanine ligase
VAKPKIAVVLGGRSAEREISVQTGKGVLAALERLAYQATTIDFDRRFISQLRSFAPGLVFNALHGGAGEDGTVQALLDWLEIPYQGSGVRASAVAMDKWLTKSLLQAEGLPAPRGVIVRLEGAWPPPIPPMIGLPCVVKPVAEGSAVNVCIVREAERWPDAVRTAAGGETRILVEEYIEGREFTVAILERDALPVVEITPHAEFYSYEAKYTPGRSTHTVPAKIDDRIARRMQECALHLHRALGCRDYSRVDVMMNESGEIFVLECNTLPGLTDVSLFPDAARASGLSYDQVVERLVQLAWSRRAGG